MWRGPPFLLSVSFSVEEKILSHLVHKSINKTEIHFPEITQILQVNLICIRVELYGQNFMSQN